MELSCSCINSQLYSIYNTLTCKSICNVLTCKSIYNTLTCKSLTCIPFTTLSHVNRFTTLSSFFNSGCEMKINEINFSLMTVKWGEMKWNSWNLVKCNKNTWEGPWEPTKRFIDFYENPDKPTFSVFVPHVPSWYKNWTIIHTINTRITIKFDRLIVLSKSSFLGWFLHVSLILIIKGRYPREVSLIVIIKQVSSCPQRSSCPTWGVKKNMNFLFLFSTLKLCKNW
jgi:hypothetical protein